MQHMPCRSLRSIARWSFAAVLGSLVLVGCGPSPGTLDLFAKPQSVLDNGDSVEIRVEATHKDGTVGSGVVKLTTSAGVVESSSVKLDAFGTATTNFSCSLEDDPGCKSLVTVTGEWRGLTSDVQVKMIERCPGRKWCTSACVDTKSDWHNCGGCGVQCSPTQACVNSTCVPCPGDDCDGDGWSPAQGDCCDQYNVCDLPTRVNPGAIEVAGNGLDDDCDGRVDLSNPSYAPPCDLSLPTSPTDPMDYARALGLCRVTGETDRTWGVVSAELLRVDGAPLGRAFGATLRPRFGTLQPLEGSRLVVMSSAVATDLVQTAPALTDADTSTNADLKTCLGPGCVNDWFEAARPPVKLAAHLPTSPKCGGDGSQKDAYDSVMLRLRIRAPTNVASFKIRGRFFSAEYPEYVCSPFNDQMIMLIDTPGANVGNPPDKNLMTYGDSMNVNWPIGINLASGTPLFQTCVTKANSPSCWDDSVSTASCQSGPADLTTTQFGFANNGDAGCVAGGATTWLATRGNVSPGSIFELRTAVWDVGDHALESLALLDDFEWSVQVADAGTE